MADNNDDLVKAEQGSKIDSADIHNSSATVRKRSRIKLTFIKLIRFTCQFVFRMLFLSAVNYIIINHLWDILHLDLYKKFIIVIITLSPTLFYIHNIYSYRNRNSTIAIEKNKAIKDKNSNQHLKVPNKHFISLIYLLIFYSGLFVAIEYFRSAPTSLSVPNLKPGTVGFRAWRSEALFRINKIEYLNSDSSWVRVPDSTIWNKNNWKYPVWVDTLKGMHNSSDYGDFTFNKKDTLYIQLKNCGAVFFPNKEVFNNYRDVLLDVTVTFISIDHDSIDVYPGIALCTRIDTKPVTNYKYYNRGNTNYMFSDLCIEFNFPFNDVALPWIPALDWQPSVIQRSSLSDLERYSHFGSVVKNIGQQYRLSAFILGKQARFTSLDFGAASLFEAKIE